MVPSWAYGTVLLVALFHLVTLYLVRAGSAKGRAAASARADRYVSGDTVECPECRAENERGYRFCRSCVSELPGAVARWRASGPARAGRRT